MNILELATMLARRKYLIQQIERLSNHGDIKGASVNSVRLRKIIKECQTELKTIEETKI